MNENEYTDADGVRRVAKKTSEATCLGCDHQFFEDGCVEAPPCFAGYRADGNWVIFVQAEKVPA